MWACAMQAVAVAGTVATATWRCMKVKGGCDEEVMCSRHDGSDDDDDEESSNDGHGVCVGFMVRQGEGELSR